MCGQCRVPGRAPWHVEREIDRGKEDAAEWRAKRETLRRAAIGTCIGRVLPPSPTSREERGETPQGPQQPNLLLSPLDFSVSNHTTCA